MSLLCGKHGEYYGMECPLCKRETQLNEQNRILERNADEARQQAASRLQLEAVRMALEKQHHEETIALEIEQHEETIRTLKESENKKLKEAKRQTRIAYEQTITEEDAYANGFRLEKSFDFSDIYDSDGDIDGEAEISVFPEPAKGYEEHDLVLQLNFDHSITMISAAPAFMLKKLRDAYINGVKDGLNKIHASPDSILFYGAFIVDPRYFNDGAIYSATFGYEIESDVDYNRQIAFSPRVGFPLRLFTDPSDGLLKTNATYSLIFEVLDKDFVYDSDVPISCAMVPIEFRGEYVARIVEGIDEALAENNTEEKIERRKKFIQYKQGKHTPSFDEDASNIGDVEVELEPSPFDKKLQVLEAISDDEAELDPWVYLYYFDLESDYLTALSIVKSSQKPLISYVSSTMKIGYNRAAMLLDIMEENGEVSPMNGEGQRVVLQKNALKMKNGYNAAADLAALNHIEQHNLYYKERNKYNFIYWLIAFFIIVGIVTKASFYYN